MTTHQRHKQARSTANLIGLLEAELSGKTGIERELAAIEISNREYWKLMREINTYNV